MKRFVCLFIVFALMISFCGCGSEEAENSENPGDSVNYRIIGETVEFEDHGYLDGYDKISIQSYISAGFIKYYL